MKRPTAIKILIFVAWAILVICGCLGLFGCSGTFETRPFTRVEYQENAWVPKDDEVYRTQSIFAGGGPSFSYSTDYVEDGETYERTWFTANLGVSAQLSAIDGAWTDYDPAAALTPDITLFLDSEGNEYISISVDASFFGEGQNYYGILTWEKTW